MSMQAEFHDTYETIEQTAKEAAEFYLESGYEIVQILIPVPKNMLSDGDFDIAGAIAHEMPDAIKHAVDVRRQRLKSDAVEP